MITRTDPTVVPSFNEKCIIIGVVQPMNALSFLSNPKASVVFRRRCCVFVKDPAAVGTSLPRPAACESRAGRRPQAAACRRGRCPRPRAPACPSGSLWPQRPPVSRSLPGHRRWRRDALRLSARPLPALRWRLAAARAGRPASPAPLAGAPRRGPTAPACDYRISVHLLRGRLLVLFPFSGYARVLCNWLGPTGTHNGLRCQEKKQLPNGE